jgi:thioredoxin 1
MTSQNVVTVTDSNFEQEVIQSSQPVLVDFWAEWCGPCKMIAPVLDEIADEKAGAVKIAKVDVDNNQALSARFGIRAIPTLLLFKNGAVQDQMVGMTSKHDLISKIDALS